jgi:hypothetical protein
VRVCGDEEGNGGSSKPLVHREDGPERVMDMREGRS